jgi:membrane-bound metal-dependent hydrolase YbcI (DUF457 family)
LLAGTVPDLDGAGILWSAQAYAAAHRAVGHGALVAVLVAVIALLGADAPWKTSPLAIVSLHLHLVLDAVGTGGLPIRYFWPFSDWRWFYADHWVLASWPNVVVMLATALGVIGIAAARRRARHAPAAAE